MIIRLSIAPDTLDHISFIDVLCSDQDRADVIQAAQKLGRGMIYIRFDSRREYSKTLHFKIEQVDSALDWEMDAENFKSLADCGSPSVRASQAFNHTSADYAGREAIRRQFLIIDGELVKFATVRVERTPNPNNILYQCWEDEDAMEFLTELPQ